MTADTHGNEAAQRTNAEPTFVKDEDSRAMGGLGRCKHRQGRKKEGLDTFSAGLRDQQVDINMRGTRKALGLASWVVCMGQVVVDR